MRSHLSGLNPQLGLLGPNPDPATTDEAALRDCWGTPDELFRWIVAGCGGRFRDYGNDVIDLFASAANAKSPVYLDADENALSLSWTTFGDRGRIHPRFNCLSLAAWLRFGNPPFSLWPQAGAKATEQSKRHPDMDIILIGPGPMGLDTNRNGASYATLHGAADAVLHLVPRVHYDPPPGIKASSPSGPTTVLAWGPAARAFTARRGGDRTEYHVRWSE